MGIKQSRLRKEIEEGTKSRKREWYTKLNLLGKGLYAEVHRCRLNKGLSYFTVKKINKSKINQEDLTEITDCLKSLEDKKISHKHIIDYYYREDRKHEFRIYMEFMKYGSLAKLYRSMKKGFDDEIVSVYTKQILLGLQYLHEKLRIIHRDIKCDNILLCEPLFIKICDLEFSIALDEKTEYIKTKCGTGRFMAPEVHAGGEYTFSADIWSLGATVLEMKLGDVPDKLNNLMETSNPMAAYESETLSEDIKKFLQLCLKQKAEQRGSIQALLNKSLCKKSKQNEDQIKELISYIQPRKVSDSKIQENVEQDLRCITFIKMACQEMSKPAVFPDNNPQQFEAVQQTQPSSVQDKRRAIEECNFNFDEETFLGKGNFGETYSCLIKNGRFYVAQKKVETSPLGDRRKLQLVKLHEYFHSNNICQDHIIQYYMSKSNPKEFHIYTEFAEFGSLADLYKTNGGFIDQQIGFYTKQVLLGLQYLHSKRIIHGAIKCSNILLTGRNTVKLSDYGLARVLKEQTVTTATQSGMSQFLAPEVNFGGNSVSYSSDIWSVGAAVLEMKLGEIPHQLDNFENGSTFEFYELKEGFSTKVRLFLRSCLNLNSQERESIEKLLEKTLCKETDILQDEIDELCHQLNDCEQVLQTLIKEYVPFRAKRRLHIESIVDMSDLCDRHSLNKNICQGTGSLVGIAGGILSTTAVALALALAPLTAGVAPLVLGIVGASVGAAGGVVGIGGSVAEGWLTKDVQNDVKNSFEEDKKSLEKVTECFRELFFLFKEKKVLNKLHYYLTTQNRNVRLSKLVNVIQPKFHSDISSGHIWINSVLSPLRGGVNIFLDVFEGVVAPVATNVARAAVRGVAAALNVVFIGIDGVLLGTALNDIAKGSFSVSGEKLRNEADKLHKEIETLDELYNSLVFEVNTEEFGYSTLLGSVLGN